MPEETNRILRSIAGAAITPPRLPVSAAATGFAAVIDAKLVASGSMPPASAAIEAAPRARTDADMMAIFLMPCQRRKSALVPAGALSCAYRSGERQGAGSEQAIGRACGMIARRACGPGSLVVADRAGSGRMTLPDAFPFSVFGPTSCSPESEQQPS